MPCSIAAWYSVSMAATTCAQSRRLAVARALAADPEDGPSLTYIERCRYFSHNPVEENWDGVFEMKTK